MKVGKRGKDLAVRIPQAVVKRLDLKKGDDVDLVAVDKHVFLVMRTDEEAA